MNAPSRLFQELSEVELHRLVDAHFPGSEIQNFHWLEGGLFNTTYLLTLANPIRKLVLRVSPVNTYLLMDFERTLMQGETMVYRLLKQAGIPSSHVVVCDVSRHLINRDYMIVDFIDSIPLSDPSLLEDERAALYEQVGRYTAEIHAISHPLFGRAAEIAIGKGHSSWLDFLCWESRSLSQRCGKHQLFSSQQLAQLCLVFEEKSALFTGISTPFLAHTDLCDGNVLVSRTSQGTPYVSAIIDADRALFGDVDFDLASPWMTHPAFYHGLGVTPPCDDGPRGEKLCAYRMLQAWEDAYVWAVEYCNPQESQRNQEKALELCHFLLSGQAAK